MLVYWWPDVCGADVCEADVCGEGVCGADVCGGQFAEADVCGDFDILYSMPYMSGSGCTLKIRLKLGLPEVLGLRISPQWS